MHDRHCPWMDIFPTGMWLAHAHPNSYAVIKWPNPTMKTMKDFLALYCQDKQCMTFSTQFPQKRISLLENLYAAEYTITNSALTDPTTVEMNRRSKSAINSKRKTGEYQMWHMILAILNFSGSLCLHFRILKPTTFLHNFKPTTFKLDTHLQIRLNIK